MMRIARPILYHLYQHYYYQITKLSKQTINEWMLPVCAARFYEAPHTELFALKKLMKTLIATSK